MFDPSDLPRVFGLAPGIDFPAALVQGLRLRLEQQPPEAMARVELIVNTRRMARRIREIFEDTAPGFLPRIRLLTDLDDATLHADLSAPVSPLRRRLELVGLVSELLALQPDLAPRTALYDLADSLVALMDEMQIEDVPPSRIAELDVSDQSGHWARAQRFLGIVQQFFDSAETAPDPAALQRIALEQRLIAWSKLPPAHPVILAGSTGSRGTTLRLMLATARLPQGAVVLPGFDFDMPGTVWDHLSDQMTGEDHPQFRFARLMQTLDLPPEHITAWTDAQPPAPQRNRVLSLALRPAPVTDQWLSEGPDLPPLTVATEGLTLVEAQSVRDEALAIALRLRQAAEDGQTAALITPDRMLSRQVTAALDRWDILPDDSAGTPPQLTPPGRFLRHVAGIFTRDLTAEALLTLLKHPLAHTGADRGDHLRRTRDLELQIRKETWPFPEAEKIVAWGRAKGCEAWALWVTQCFCLPPVTGERPLTDWLADHLARAERIAAGSASDIGAELWAQTAGRALREIVDELVDEAPHSGNLGARDYADLFGAVLARGEVRDRDAPRPDILIWGTLEARVMGADLLILGGLNEGTWPEMPAADPWLNRKMRLDAGLLLPERRIGLSAHDFQQAFAAPEVWLTRAAKTDDAETVPSRWINRLTNLMRGLPEREGPDALDAMRARGDHWLALTRAIEAPLPAPRAPRPSPVPPVTARPDRLSVTRIKHLIRDPYAIYAQSILRLYPLNPLQRAPDALLRGTVVHEVMEAYLKATLTGERPLTAEALIALAQDVLATDVPFATMRHLWKARIARIAEWFVTTERARQALATPHIERLEIRGTAALSDPAFTLVATADRIDLDPRGTAVIYDYKTGSPPTKAVQKKFDKQLLLEAAMLEQGAFAPLGPLRTERAAFIGLGPNPSEVAAPLDDTPPAQVWAEFQSLIRAFFDPDQGYTARRAMLKETDISDFDQLARYGEWDTSEPATRLVLE